MIADYYRIRIYLVSITDTRPNLPLGWFAPVDQKFPLVQPLNSRALRRVERYCMLLVAGWAGRQIYLEHKFPQLLTPWRQEHLEQRFALQVRRAEDFEGSVAYGLALGWLGEKDHGQPLDTLERLWRQANRLLHRPRQRSRLIQLAEQLLRAGCMSGAAIGEFLRSRPHD